MYGCVQKNTEFGGMFAANIRVRRLANIIFVITAQTLLTSDKNFMSLGF